VKGTPAELDDIRQAAEGGRPLPSWCRGHEAGTFASTLLTDDVTAARNALAGRGVMFEPASLEDICVLMDRPC
jgi:hypothetical protein